MIRTVLNNSDVGPWYTLDLTEEEGLVHAVPSYGPEHRYCAECWCHPVEFSGVMVHNVAQ